MSKYSDFQINNKQSIDEASLEAKCMLPRKPLKEKKISFSVLDYVTRISGTETQSESYNDERSDYTRALDSHGINSPEMPSVFEFSCEITEHDYLPSMVLDSVQSWICSIEEQEQFMHDELLSITSIATRLQLQLMIFSNTFLNENTAENCNFRISRSLCNEFQRKSNQYLTYLNDQIGNLTSFSQLISAIEVGMKKSIEHEAEVSKKSNKLKDKSASYRRTTEKLSVLQNETTEHQVQCTEHLSHLRSLFDWAVVLLKSISHKTRSSSVSNNGSISSSRRSSKSFDKEEIIDKASSNNKNEDIFRIETLKVEYKHLEVLLAEIITLKVF